MVFSTVLFLFRFLPITLALYYLAPARLKNTVLFLCSLVFYSWGEVRLFPVMAAAILINYTAGLGIERFKDSAAARRGFLLFSIIGSLGMLFFFKYTDFFINNINAVIGTSIPLLRLTLPLGISFYTFQTMSYSIDVYRGDVKAEHNLINFGAYVVMFPQLIAGPIVKYSDVAERLHILKGRVTMDRIDEGISLFIFGLAKKVLLADGISALWYDVIGHDVNGVWEAGVGLSNASTPLVWLGIISYALQIYFDFSGYSMMGIGMGKMLGFDFPDNFNLPYISRSITEFWRRWHITLSSWFKEYVYIPLGGNRKGLARQILNILIVWTLTGIWHGAGWNFLFWGLWFAFFLILEKLFLGDILESVPKVFGRIYTLAVVLISWVFFALEKPGEIPAYLQAMFGLNGVGLMNTQAMFLGNEYLVLLIIALVACLPVGSLLIHRLKSSKTGPAMALYRVGEKVIPAALLILSVAYIVDASYNPFLYFRF